ncbi:MAG: nucleotidyltransferase substrate binding protein [Pseudomonadota bacterium]
MNKTIRWQQRFENYEKAFAQLEKTIAIKKPNDAERAGLIQFFEVSFELAWKTLRDYLESAGYTTQSPRDAIKQAFQSQLISNGEAWLEALDNRNLTVHTYDEKTAVKIETLIRKSYYPELKAFHKDFGKKKT